MLRIELDQEAPAAIRVVRPHQRTGRDLGDRKHPEVSIELSVDFFHTLVVVGFYNIGIVRDHFCDELLGLVRRKKRRNLRQALGMLFFEPFANTCLNFGPPPHSFQQRFELQRIIQDRSLAKTNQQLVEDPGYVPFTEALLFHELVHVEQYRHIGVSRFADLYLKDFLNGGGYFEIPLEQNALCLG